ncbi:MAG TPA: hypothetical protein VK034_18350 [Enhygromyxa sp.]|nr:hypothetical protein [Enhygromyxa sp.]
MAFRDKQLEDQLVSHAIGQIGGDDLRIDADFSYTYYEALSGRVPWFATAFYKAGIWLRIGDIERLGCLTPSHDEFDRAPRKTCAVDFLDFPDEQAWRAAQDAFEVAESCLGPTRAAIRLAIDDHTIPSDGWIVVENAGAEPSWMIATAPTCTDALALEIELEQPADADTQP